MYYFIIKYLFHCFRLDTTSQQMTTIHSQPTPTASKLLVHHKCLNDIFVFCECLKDVFCTL